MNEFFRYAIGDKEIIISKESSGGIFVEIINTTLEIRDGHEWIEIPHIETGILYESLKKWTAKG